MSDTTRPLIVRNRLSLTVFEVDPETLEPKQCSVYDPYCYSDPRPGVDYMEWGDWCRVSQRKEREATRLRG